MSVVGRDAEAWEGIQEVAVEMGRAFVDLADDMGVDRFDDWFLWNGKYLWQRMDPDLRDALMEVAGDGPDAIGFETMRDFIHFLVSTSPLASMFGQWLAARRLLREAQP